VWLMSDFLYRFGFGLTGRSLIALLRREQPQDDAAAGGTAAPAPRPPGASTSVPIARLPKNAETSVVVSIGDSLAARDARHARTLLRKQKALTNAAHARFDAVRRLNTARAHPRWANEDTAEDRAALALPSSNGTSPEGTSPEGTSPEGTSPDGTSPDDTSTATRWRRARPAAGTGTFREMFDPHRPLIAERTLVIIEAVFVVVEFAFWYGVFSGNVEAHASAFDLTRISDILLAVMIPLSGIVAARVVGGLTHRAMRSYPGIGRSEYIGAAVSAAVAGLAIAAIFGLVHARFAAAAGTALTVAVFQPPALAMTLVFVVVLAGDMIARIFLVSEIRAQTEKWHRQLDRLMKRATRANRNHVKSWLDLRNAVQRYLDTCERVVSAGARIISDERSRNGTTAPSLPAATALVREAHVRDGEHATTGPMAVPSLAQLQLFGVNLAPGPLRVAADAVDTLREWPPFHQEDLATHVGGMAERLYRLSSASSTQTSREAPAAPSSEPAVEAQGQGPRFQPTEPLRPGRPGEHPGERNGEDPEAEHSEVGRDEGP
jgi:hypothetical protein